MQQTEQGRARRPDEAAKQQKQQQARSRPDSAQQLLTLAVQSLQAGMPLERLPAPLILALSGQIGNSALLELMAGQGRGPDTARTYPPAQPVLCRALPVQTGEPAAADAPAWSEMPAVQAAPAAPAALGGAAFAGG